MAAQSFDDLIPPSMKGSPVHFATTTTGEVIAIVESTGENLATAMNVQASINRADNILENAARTKQLVDTTNKVLKPDQEKVAALQKSLEPYLNSEKIIDVERLRSRKGVEQIENFRKYTDNFTNLEKLTPEEILYLNLCDWLEPQAKLINTEIKSLGLKITEVKDGITCLTEIHELDLFHSLLGEMRPGSVADAMSGGHWFSPELKATIFKFDKLEAFQRGYFDLFLKHARGNSMNFKPKTFFPLGHTIDDCASAIIDCIKNPKNKILSGTTDKGKQIFNLTNLNDLGFRMYIEKGIVRFSPLSPYA